MTVTAVEGNTVTLENQIRDTVGDWFYWAFCVEGAEGQTLTFQMQPNRLGYFGPAVSHDFYHWHWLDRVDGDNFTYTFGQDESKVYFAHHMLYPMARLEALAKTHGIALKTLCQSRKGRSVPYLTFGEGEQTLFLTARHHACESTGSYVLEGVLSALLQHSLANTRVICVPFVDYDGVIEGDQGKNRSPHDHNRDYIDAPLYPETTAIMELADTYGCHMAFDFHSPWHKGGENDYIFVVQNRVDRIERFQRFSAILERECHKGSMLYQSKNDHPPMTGWNRPGPSFSQTMHSRPECGLAFSLENTYFGTPENKVSIDRLLAFGEVFAKTIRIYSVMQEEIK